MKKILFSVFALLSINLFVGCSQSDKPKTTEIINNTSEPIKIKIGTFKGYNDFSSRYIFIGTNSSIEIESVDDEISVLYPKKYWSLGKVYTSSKENLSIEVNPTGFYVETF